MDESYRTNLPPSFYVVPEKPRGDAENWPSELEMGDLNHSCGKEIGQAVERAQRIGRIDDSGMIDV